MYHVSSVSDNMASCQGVSLYGSIDQLRHLLLTKITALKYLRNLRQWITPCHVSGVPCSVEKSWNLVPLHTLQAGSQV